MENYDSMIVFYIGAWPVSMTIFSTWIVIALLALLSWLATRRMKVSQNVSRFQTFMEAVVLFVHQEIYETSNDNPKKYIGMALTLFLFIALCNVLTIIPGFRPPTASLSTTLAMSLVVFIAIPIYSVMNAGWKGYLHKFIEPTPLMLPINIFSDISSTLAMALRLYGNMISGTMFAFILTSFMPFLLPLPMTLLGLLTGTIQAYIFMLLAIVYTSSLPPQQPYIHKERR